MLMIVTSFDLTMHILLVCSVVFIFLIKFGYLSKKKSFES